MCLRLRTATLAISQVFSNKTVINRLKNKRREPGTERLSKEDSVASVVFLKVEAVGKL